MVAQAGIPTGISIAPIIPGLNDDDIPELLSRAREAGATVATSSLLRLSGSVEAVFLDRMREAFPDRIQKIIHRLRDVRGGPLSDGRYFRRQQGTGHYWHMIQDLFRIAKRKAGFQEDDDGTTPDTFRRPGTATQASLF